MRVAERMPRRGFGGLSGRVRMIMLIIAGSVAIVPGAIVFPARAGVVLSSHPATRALQGPSARYDASMVYDAARHNIVLFGGAVYGAVLGDTWVFNGSAWTRLSPTVSPPARDSAMMTYDPRMGASILYGGQLDNAFPVGTWVWKGTNWTELSTSPSPPREFGSAMNYDPATGNVVLFGGNNNTNLNSDTWIWNGTAWTKLSPSRHPSAAEDAVMAYDARTHQMVEYGGSGIYKCLFSTWTWNGTTWTLLKPTHYPDVCTGMSMAYDPATGQLVLFGGIHPLLSGGFVLRNETWTWNGIRWTKLSPRTSPSARYGASMAYDQATHQLVLFGGGADSGKVTYGDTWVWNGTTWTKL